MMRNILQDIVFGVRMLKQNMGITLLAVFVLSIGIGLVVTVFSIVNGFLIKGLPFDEPERIFSLRWARSDQNFDWNDILIKTHDLIDFKEQQTTFEGLCGYDEDSVNIKGDDYARRCSGVYISANFLDVLRVRPLLGRRFFNDEELPGKNPVVIIGYGIWQKDFYGDKNIIGRTMLLNGAPRTIVGVMSQGFNFPLSADLWIPYRNDFPLKTRINSRNFKFVFGRLKDGVNVDETLTEFNGIAARLEQAYPESNEGLNALDIEPYTEVFMGDWMVNRLLTMLGAVFLVLLITCGNVANLLLARSTLRSKELAIRSAIGAPRKRIIIQILTESLLISIMGALGGILLAKFTLDYLWNYFKVILMTSWYSIPSWVNFEMDWVVLIFIIGLTLLTGIISGIVPAFKASKTDVNQLLKEDTRTSSSLRVGRFSKCLVIVQIALCCVLLIGAGLMIKMVNNLNRFDLPYDPGTIFQARTVLHDTEYPTNSDKLSFFASLLRNLKTIPGIEAVALTTTHSEPFADWKKIIVDGENYVTKNDYPWTCFAGVSIDYYDVFNASILEGRPFYDTDITDSQQVAIVNTDFAERYWPKQSAIGKRFKLYHPDGMPWLTIVGVAPDLQMQGFNWDDQERFPGFYVPMTQKSAFLYFSGNVTARYMTLVLKGLGRDPMNWLPTVRSEVQKLNPNQPLYDIKTVQSAIDDRSRGRKFFTGLFIAFGIAATFLASIGVYGVMSFSVNQRTQEMGIRKALGADPRLILTMIIKQSNRQIGAGIFIGLLLAIAFSKILHSIYSNFSPYDLSVYITVIGVIVLVGLLSVWIPARVAARVEPMEALRY